MFTFDPGQKYVALIFPWLLVVTHIWLADEFCDD